MSTTVHAESNFLIPNGTFLAELVIFLVILAVMGRLIVPPVQQAMRQRRELIRAQFKDARAAARRAEAAEAEYHKAMNDARAEGARIREEARTQGQQIIDEARAAAQQEADRIAAEAHRRLITERDALERELRAEMGALGVELASRIVGEPLADDVRRSGTVERFLAELDRQPAPAAAGESG